MGAVTGLLYVLLVVFGAGWYFNRWTGNFSLLLFILTLVTFAYWLAERLYFSPRRRQAVAAFDLHEAGRRKQLADQGIARVDDNTQAARGALLMQPWWLDWTAGLFPVILAVFLLRSFLFEPFKIPSGSMMPTLLVGDLILVNKFYYGIRLPVANKKIVAVHDPERGDVMVFRYPRDPSTDFIKRVVGLPGDEIRFENQQLFVNGALVPAEATPPPGFYDEDARRYLPEFTEKLGAIQHRILINPESSTFWASNESNRFPFRENCRYSGTGVTCKVPAGNYFMMGDNRDNSLDSRYWGFVPDENIVGKAFLIWMNFGDLKRIGPFQ
ncbi:MAG: signal peptidase I [Pseudomonadota bacterium]|nr:signal peptidase I [Pseudomonadota bacterium]